jgi:hypothetical protein
MLQGHVIFSTMQMHVMAINFTAGMESCLTAKHQVLSNGFFIIHFSVQGLAKVFSV